jgi:cytochrome c oxidase assembly protein subunit 15
LSRSTNNPWLHRFAVLTAGATLLLICLGGEVTSRGVGLAVPDWPTTYGQNMFLFPPSQWQGGVFYEHTHRLVASLVGLLTVALAAWLWLKESRVWLRRLGLLAVALVIAQGVMGGLRVTEMNDALGIFHAALAQLFLVLVAAMALVTSKAWTAAPPLPALSPASGGGEGGRRPGEGARFTLLLATGLIFAQLLIGATMRHQHAGLAIPDFPLAYGRVWPAMDAESVARYNAQRVEVRALNPITAAQVALQMAHRLMAGVILGAVALAAWRARRAFGTRSPLARAAWAWLGLIFTQAALGAATIWTGKAPLAATAHVALGAASLVTGALLWLSARRRSAITASVGAAGVLPTEPVLKDNLRQQPVNA